MSKPKGDLGRGLAALIPTGPQTNVVSDVFMGGATKRFDTPTKTDPDPSAELAESRESAEPEQSDEWAREGGQVRAPGESGDATAPTKPSSAGTDESLSTSAADGRAAS